MDLREHYLSYISQINAGQCGSGGLSKYVHEGVVHNDSRPMPVDDYAQIIIDSQADLPGLLFEVDMLVVEEAHDDQRGPGDGSVAARLKLTYSPEPLTTETFFEHVFYRFEGGKIRRVWSLLDGAGLKWKEAREGK